MENQNLILLRNFLFKVFIVGLSFAIFLFAITTIFWVSWSSFICSNFQLTQKEVGELVFNSFLYLRFYLVFVILVPAISLHWLIKSIKD